MEALRKIKTEVESGKAKVNKNGEIQTEDPETKEKLETELEKSFKLWGNAQSILNNISEKEEQLKADPTNKLGIILRLDLDSDYDSPENILRKKIKLAKDKRTNTKNKEEQEALDDLIREYGDSLAILE